MPNLLMAPASMQTANPLSQGSLSLQSSNGVKATSPGGINTTNANTLSSANTSPQQTATTPSLVNPNAAWQNTITGSLGTPVTPSSSSFSIAPQQSPQGVAFGNQQTNQPTNIGAAVNTAGTALGHSVQGLAALGSSIGNYLVAPAGTPFSLQSTTPTTASPLSQGTLNLNQGSISQLLAATPQNNASSGSLIQSPQQPTYSPQGNTIIPTSSSPYNQSTYNPSISTTIPGVQSSAPTNYYSPTNTPQQTASNLSPNALAQNLIGQSQTTLQDQQNTAQQQIAANQATIAAAQQEAEALTGGSFTGTAAGYTGRLAQLAQIVQNAQANINSAQQNLSMYTAQSQNALSAGLGAATNYISSPYGQPLYNPLSGTMVSGGAVNGGGTGTSASSLGPQAVQSLAQQVVGGTQSYQNAVASLGYMGSAGQQMLNQAITAIQPNFNFNQAAQNAQIQGTIGPQSSLANSVLSQLQTALQNAPQLQQTGYPAINALSGLINDMGLGGSQAQAASQTITSDLQEARTAVSNALGTAYNTTPTAFTSLVNSWFPDNITPAQLQASITAFQNLMSARTASFGSPGTVPLPSGSASNQTQTVAGITYTQNAQGQWVAQ